jgi:4-hydroxybenzoate polyprenyltransferase
MRTTAVANYTRAMIITMRPYLLFLSGITGLAGIAAAGSVPLATIIPVFLASFLSYGFGQALTDCFQTDTDAISAPYRPLVRGIISRKAVLVSGLLGLILCSVIFAAGNVLNLACGMLAVGGLATYTWFKRRWWGGPWYNAWIVCVLFLMGYLAGTGAAKLVLPGGLAPLLLIVFSGYANFVIAGYFKDIEADRQTGYNTFPVVFGRKAASIVSDLFAAGAVAGLLIHLIHATPAWPTLWEAAPCIVFSVWGVSVAVRGQVLLHGNTDDHTAHVPIRLVVESYILILSAAITAIHPWWSAPLLAFYAAFQLVLRYRTEVSQI